MDEFRAFSGLSRRQIYEAVGKPKSTYYDWEYGGSCIDPLALKLIVYDIFHIPVEEFLDDSIPTQELIDRYIVKL